MAAEFPSEISFDVFQRVGVDTVLVHRGRPEGVHLYSEIPLWCERGKLDLVARFSGPLSHMYRGTADEVYRLMKSPLAVATPFPSGRPLRDPAWTYRATRGDAELAVDDNLKTSWNMSRPLMGDELFEVDFGKPLRISGLVLRLRRSSVFPPRFRIVGRTAEGRRLRLAGFDVEHAAQYVDALLESPGEAAIGFDLEGAVVRSLALRISRGGTRFDGSPIPGWSIPEIEIWVSDKTARDEEMK
jgi:hypothetical protein